MSKKKGNIVDKHLLVGTQNSMIYAAPADIPTNKVVAVNYIDEGGERQNVINTSNNNRLLALEHALIANDTIGVKTAFPTQESISGSAQNQNTVNQEVVNWVKALDTTVVPLKDVATETYLNSGTNQADANTQAVTAIKNNANNISRLQTQVNDLDTFNIALDDRATEAYAGTETTQKAVNVTTKNKFKEIDQFSVDVGNLFDTKVNKISGTNNGRRSHIETIDNNNAVMEQIVTTTDNRGFKVTNINVQLWDSTSAGTSRIQLNDNGHIDINTFEKARYNGNEIATTVDIASIDARLKANPYTYNVVYHGHSTTGNVQYFSIGFTIETTTNITTSADMYAYLYTLGQLHGTGNSNFGPVYAVNFNNGSAATIYYENDGTSGTFTRGSGVFEVAFEKFGGAL